jgi:2-polyprenyl-6-methoxyphenol hydroxylase-like FAD-dependent oxidoreductase
MTSTNPEVLICGAGPTGLMLALRLARSGVRVKIVDPAAEPGTTSRALVVHARTLEFYRQMGLAEALLEESVKFEAVNLWVGGRRVRRVAFEELGKGLSPFPYMVVCTQDRHERFLIEHLGRAGVQVERQLELVDFQQSPDGVRARLRGADGAEETCEAAYLAGCDGARSKVRDVLGSGFPGGTYEQFFYVADVDGTGPVMNNELHVALDDAAFLGIFPLRGNRTARLIGSIRADQESVRQSLRFEDVGGHVAARMGIDVERVNWFSTYRVHHRVARRFREGRVFLLGDAAHIHSPVGGQGMNTGLGDAVNLAWKLAEVLQGRARPALLDTYEPERRAFAKKLVGTTDRAFVVATSPGRLARFARMNIVPRVLPVVFHFQAMQRFMFRVVSQISIHYRRSPISAGNVGAVHGGDRLPWVAPPAGSPDADNFALIDGRQWRVHVYGAPQPGTAEICQALALPLDVFAWRAAMSKSGLTEGAVYLVRPDGYVALVDAGTSPAILARQIAAVVNRPTSHAVAAPAVAAVG